MDIVEIARSHARILRHFLCRDCQVGLFIITGDAEATLAECPRCEKKYNIRIEVAELKGGKDVRVDQP